MKRVLITGSAKRLGAVMARYLAARGWQPVIHYHSSAEEARRLADELGTVAVGADLGNPREAETLIGLAASAAGGPIEALVNSASVFEYDTATTVGTDLLDLHYRTNLVAPVLLAQQFAAQADKLGDPVIVNILDQKLHNLNADHFSYTLSKSALDTATMMMARSFAPQIRVCGVAPGYTLPGPGETEEEFARKAPAANPLARRLLPDQVAQAVAFCLDCPAITGQTILADNGEHLIPKTRDISFQEKGE